MALTGSQKTTKNGQNRAVNGRAAQQHGVRAGAEPTRGVLDHQSAAVGDHRQPRPSWPAMIPASAPARGSRVNLQASPLPSSAREAAGGNTGGGVGRSAVRRELPDGVRNERSLNELRGGANRAGVIVMGKLARPHWLLATSSSSWRNRESAGARAQWGVRR